jgi:histidyl-tRNA synthetase
LKSKSFLKVNNKKDYFIIDITEDKKTAYKISAHLREKGFKVARDIVDRDYKDSIKFAFKNGFKYVIVIGIEKNKNELYLFEEENKYKKITIEELIK